LILKGPFDVKRRRRLREHRGNGREEGRRETVHTRNKQKARSKSLKNNYPLSSELARENNGNSTRLQGISDLCRSYSLVRLASPHHLLSGVEARTFGRNNFTLALTIRLCGFGLGRFCWLFFVNRKFATILGLDSPQARSMITAGHNDTEKGGRGQ
jgi:hypothetical protein